MRKIAYVVSLMLCIAIFGCTNQGKEAEKVRSSIDGWIEAGTKVAARSKKLEVASIMDFVKETSYKIAPHKGDISSTAIAFEILDDKLPESTYKLGITCLSKKHREFGSLWQKVWDSKNYAFLQIPEGAKESSILVLKDEAISETWKGIVFIHEASHAVEHALHLYDSISDPELRNAQYELTTYTLEGEILAELGGAKLAAIQQLEIGRLKKELAEGKTVYPRVDLYSMEMEEIFGKAESDREKQMRADLFWIDSMLKMYEEQADKKKATQDELIFMMEVGKNRGIM